MEDKEKEELLRANQELAEENRRMAKYYLSPSQIIGGCIGLIIYILIKSIGNYDWVIVDIFGIIIFVCPAMIIGMVLFNKLD